MKRCPECRRDYYDDTLSFCLEDGTSLDCGISDGEPATAVLSEPPAVAGGFTQRAAQHNEAATAIFAKRTALSNARHQPPATAGGSDALSKPRGKVGGWQRAKRLAGLGIAALILAGGFFGF